MTKKGTPMDLNDDLSDLLGGTPKAKPLADHTPDWYREKAPATHIEVCPKCRGTGRFVSYSGRTSGTCFTCKGAGKRTFKTSGADRAKARAQHEDRQDAKRASNLDAFKAEHPAAHAWLLANGSDFAVSLLKGIAQYGSLTEGQLAAVERNIARDESRAAERAARIENAPVVEAAGVDRLKQAFDKAAAATAAKGVAGLTLRQPRITIGEMVISAAKADSKNPGALYVKGRDRVYLGKIASGKFVASRECTPEQQATIVAFVADPAGAAKAYGIETGVCCVCNAVLKSEWRLKGIGPICSQKFGF
jgi:hypothetical protein